MLIWLLFCRMRSLLHACQHQASADVSAALPGRVACVVPQGMDVIVDENHGAGGWIRLQVKVCASGWVLVPAFLLPHALLLLWELLAGMQHGCSHAAALAFYMRMREVAQACRSSVACCSVFGMAHLRLLWVLACLGRGCARLGAAGADQGAEHGVAEHEQRVGRQLGAGPGAAAAAGHPNPGRPGRGGVPAKSGCLVIRINV